MGFDCANIYSVLLTAGQSELLTGPALPSGNPTAKTGLFADHLSRIVRQDGTADAARQSRTGLPLSGQSEMTDLPADELEKLSGTAFLVKLKTILHQFFNNRDLKRFTIDPDGLTALKGLLIKAGFSPETVNDMIEKLSETLQDKKMSLAEVIRALDTLPENDPTVDSGMPDDDEDTTGTEGQAFLAASSIPYIKSLLTLLRVPHKKIDTLISEISDPETGVNLDLLIEKLQQLAKAAVFSGTPFKSSNPDKGFQTLLASLDLDNPSRTPTELTLDELVAAFTALRENMSRADRSSRPAGEAENGSWPSLHNKIRSSGNIVSQLAELLTHISAGEKNLPVNTFEDTVRTHARASSLLGMAAAGPDGQDDPAGGIDPYREHPARKTVFTRIQAAAGKTASDGDGRLQTDRGLEAALNLSSKNHGSNRAGTDPVIGMSLSRSGTITDYVEPRVQPTLKNLPNYVTHQVGRGLVRAINQGMSELRIQIKPPELGRMLMTIDHSGNTMKVSIMAENQAAKDILISNVNELKTVLSNSGINLESFEVDLGGDLRQSMADAKSQAGLFGKNGRGGANRPGNGAGDDDPPVETVETVNGMGVDGSLHFVA